MSINEQVKELRKAAKWFDTACFPEGVKLANEAAETIEALSAKLETANKELERWHTDKINDKIKNPFAWTSTLCCHNCDHKDEYIEELEAADMERSAEDCGGVWILCKDRLPGEKEGVKIGSTDKEFLVTIKNFSGGEYCTVSRFEEPIQDFWHDNVVAWQIKPEPFREH